MTTPSLCARRSAAAGMCVFGVILWVAACSGEPTRVPSASPGESLSAVPPISAAAIGDIKVTSTKPDSGVRETTLDVSVFGGGFAPGGVATWALKGIADPTQIRTNSTKYVSQRELVANITITGSATVARWDVMVTSSGKTGVGTELFAVKENGASDPDSRALLVWDASVDVSAPGQAPDVRPAGIVGDDRDRYGAPSASSEYQGHFCGVHAKIWWWAETGSRSGDLVFGPETSYQQKDKVCGSRRLLHFYMNYVPAGDRGAADAMEAFVNTRQVMQLAVGASRTQILHFSLSVRGCERLQFDTALGGTVANVRVTRLADVGTSAKGDAIAQWRVESVYPHGALCMKSFRGTYASTGVIHYLPFAFTATEVPRPYPAYP